MSHVVSDGRTYVTHLYPKRFVCLSLWPFYLAVASGCCRWLLIDSSGFIDSSGSAVQHLRRAIMTSRHVSLQGKFYRYKTPNHPHTNMAKAALNMMTRTCAEDLARDGILMNSVDTGWINDENPLEKVTAAAGGSGWQRVAASGSGWQRAERAVAGGGHRRAEAGVGARYSGSGGWRSVEGGCGRARCCSPCGVCIGGCVGNDVD